MRFPNRESAIEKAVALWCKKNGVWFIKIQGQGNKGMPDRLVLLPNGRVLWMELKAPGCKPTPLQEYTHEQLRKSGHAICVCDNRPAAVAAILDASRLPEEGRQVPA